MYPTTALVQMHGVILTENAKQVANTPATSPAHIQIELQFPFGSVCSFWQVARRRTFPFVLYWRDRRNYGRDLVFFH